MRGAVAAFRYARALADVVLDPASGLDARDVERQLERVSKLMAQSTELRHVMLSPAVASSKKRGVIGQLSGELCLAPKIRDFIYVIIDHGRMHMLPEIRSAFELSVDEALGFVKADVSSAQSLSGAQRAALGTQLTKLTGKQVRMQFSTDDTLIGGVVARIGSTVYDGSVRGNLAALKHRLSTES
jgi:F-type H+-transporting ATPase subunit delta